jgi:hypothetical protein
MSRPTYTRVPDSDTIGSTSYRSLSHRESDSNLVPRTPHSRSGGQTSVQDVLTDLEYDGSRDDLDESYEMTHQSQAAPLLASSASANFGDDVHLHANRLMDTESRGHLPASRRALNRAISHLPLVLGGVFSIMLCLLIFVSIHWPDTLHALLQSSAPEALDNAPTPSFTLPGSNGSTPNNTVGMAHNHTSSASTLIDYSAYTSFPLTPEQYRFECWKQQSNHYHGGYWGKPPCEFSTPSIHFLH